MEQGSRVPRELSVAGMVLLAATIWLVGSAAGQADSSAGFQSYVARGYREIADYAATKVGDAALAAHFGRRAPLAAAGQVAPPESLGQWPLAAGRAAEAGTARRQLIARLDAGARQR